MEIKVKLEKDEVKEIVKAHVLKEIPYNAITHDIEVHESYGTFTVEISEKDIPEGRE